MDYDIALPHFGSVILTHRWNGTVRGLDAFPRNDWPVVVVTFFAFRIMVGLGILMLALGLASLWLRLRGHLYDRRWFRWLAVAMGPAGFVAILAGWTTTETGRQPWVVYNLMRTSAAVSAISVEEVATSFAVISVIYLIVFGSGIRYLLAMMSRPPETGEPLPSPETSPTSRGLLALPMRKRG